MSVDEATLLPVHYVPTHYDVNLTIDLAQSRFKGTVTIALQPSDAARSSIVRAGDPTMGCLSHMSCANNELLLHSKDLVLSDVAVSARNSETVLPATRASSVSHANEETVRLQFESVDFFQLRDDGVELSLSVKFEAPLRQDQSGLYRTTFVQDGVERVLAGQYNISIAFATCAHSLTLQ